MSAEGMTATILATQLTEALKKDGILYSWKSHGPAVSAWLREVAKELSVIERLGGKLITLDPNAPHVAMDPGPEGRALIRESLNGEQAESEIKPTTEKDVQSKPRRRRCANCKELKEGVITRDNPYKQDIEGLTVKEPLCDRCFRVLLDEI